MRKLLLALGLTALLLAGCNTTQAPPKTGDGGGPKVTVLASFPTETKPSYPPKPPYPWIPNQPSGSLKPQGVPGADRLYASLKVYQGPSLVDQATLTPSQPSTTLSLPAGATYRFELLVKGTSWGSATEYELAWAETTQYIAGDTTLNLVPRAIVGSVHLETPYPANLDEGKLMGLGLWVNPPHGWSASFPVDDYAVTYEPGYWDYTPEGYRVFIPSDAYLSIEAQSKVGVLVRAKPGSGGKTVGVRATVRGLGSNKQEQDFVAEAQIPVLEPTLPTDDSILLSGTVANWPLDANLSAQVRVQSPSGTAVGALGAVDASGSLSIPLPPGSDIRDHLSSLPWETPGCTTSWTVQPDPLNLFEPVFSVRSGGTEIGQLYVANSETEAYQPGYKMGFYVYADRETTGQGTQTCTYDGGGTPVTTTLEYNFTLRKGWNLIVVEYTSQGIVVTGGPNNGTLPEGLHWYFTRTIGNASVNLNLDFSHPYGYIRDPRNDTVSYGSTVLINGDARDDRVVADVRLYANAQEIPVTIVSGALGTSSSVNWQASWNPPAPGFYHLDLIVVNGGGNSYRDYTYVWVR